MKGPIILLILGLLIGLLSTLFPRPEEATTPALPEVRGMIASYYGDGFHGKCMANGEMFDKEAMTAASKEFRLGTKLTVHRGQYSIDVVVTDRGPYIKGRHLDLSEGAARELNMLDVGVSPVVVEVLEVPKKNKKYHKKYNQCLARNNQQSVSYNPGAIRGFPVCYTHTHGRHHYSKLFLPH